MKKLGTIIIAVLLAVNVFAQAPEKLSYQAVIRDNGGQLIINQQVGMQVSILQGSENGTAVYVETQTPISNTNGLITTEIGAGIIVSGDFSAIDWSQGPYFIKTETDPAGGTSYSVEGTSELLSVTYALHSKTAEELSGPLTELDPVFQESLAAGISEVDTAYWNSKQEPVIAGTGIDISGSTISSQIPDGANEGEMLYWDGSAWVIIAPGVNTQKLSYCNGTPTWGPCPISVVTSPASMISSNYATVGGDVTSDGGSTVTDHGVYWSASPNPTAADNVVSNGAGSEGPFSVNVLGLSQSTTYYVRAYATNSGGTSVGDEVSFTTTDYHTAFNAVINPVTGKTWMDRNLGATQVAQAVDDASSYGWYYQWGRVTDGHQLPSAGSTTQQSSTDQPGHGDVIYTSSNDWRNPSNDNLWQGVNGINNPCPAGYRIPTEAEWVAEINTFSSNNSSGAFGSVLSLPVAGFGYGTTTTDDLINLGSIGVYWTSDAVYSGGNNIRIVVFQATAATFQGWQRNHRASVRCIMD